MKIEAEGLLCPEPIMMLHKVINEVEHGEIIELFATDPSTERDVERFCNFLGHNLIEKKIEKEKEKFYYLVEKQDKHIINKNLENQSK
jgi:tRNA 2-thiouridine synthesizing protein A